MKSTPSSFKHDNMSLKSGFSIKFFLERPGVESKLPHHTDQLGRGLVLQIILLRVVQRPLPYQNRLPHQTPLSGPSPPIASQSDSGRRPRLSARDLASGKSSRARSTWGSVSRRKRVAASPP